MRVAFYTISLFRKVTGTERVALRVAKALRAAGHELVWIAPAGAEPPVEPLPDDTVVVLVPYGFSGIHIERLRTAICDQKPDVMVVLIANGMVSLFSQALCGLNVPLLISEHNDPAYYVSRWWGIGSDEEMQHRMRIDSMQCADRIHLLSRRFAEDLPEQVRERVRVIANSVPQTSLRADMEKGPDGRCRFVSIGRLSEQKALHLSIEAFALFAARHPEWDYHIFGTGEEQVELQAQVESLGLSERILFRGHTAMPLEELADSQILLMPSLFEAWPLVAGEAQAVGLPVIGIGDCDALAEMFADDHCGGCLAEERSATSLAGVMTELAESRVLRKEMAREGLDAALDYGAEIIDRRWLDLIEETAALEHSRLEDCILSGEDRVIPSTAVQQDVQEAVERLRVNLLEAAPLPSQPSLMSRLVRMAHVAVTRPRKEVATVAVKRLKTYLRHQAMPAGRAAARMVPKRGVTLLTLPGIEDGPRHLAPWLQRPPDIIKIPPRLLFAARDLVRIGTSQVIVTEGGLPERFQTGQQVIQLWHSSGFIKKAANLARRLSIREFHRTNGRYDYVICPSIEMAPLYAEAFCVDLPRVLPLGSVKTDYLLQKEVREEYVRKLLERAPELAGKKVYVYAPTFRGEWPACTFHYAGLSLDELEEMLDEDERLLIHLHPNFSERPLAEQARRTNLIPREHHKRVMLASHLPMEWLQAAAFCLISDYSGALLDAVAGCTPVVCFAHDVESYAKQLTPGFLDQVPGLVTESSARALVNGIRAADNSSKLYRAFRRRWVGACDGESGKRVARIVEGR